MKTCPNCHRENPDESAFCACCGAPMNGQPAYQPAAEPEISPWDHTGDYEEADIRENKIFAMAAYLLGLPGILLALLANKDSALNRFHIRQALKIAVLEVLLGLFAGVLCWTILIPIVCGILMLCLLVVRIAAFVDVLRNKVKEVFLIRNLSFLN